MKIYSLILIFICSFLSAQYYVYVTKVVDGDTFHTQLDTYRIAEIDAPELNQTYGKESKEFLSKKILKQRVWLHYINTDRYGRKIVKVYLNKKDIGYEMVATGNAWWYKKYAPENNYLKYLHDTAKKSKFGLWKYKYVEPRKFRRYERF